MGMGDVQARFAAVRANDGTVAALIRDECASAAKAINAAVVGEPTELQAVLQFLEQAAHVGLRSFRDTPVTEQAEQQEAPVNTAEGQGTTDDAGTTQARAKSTKGRAKGKVSEETSPS